MHTTHRVFFPLFQETEPATYTTEYTTEYDYTDGGDWGGGDVTTTVEKTVTYDYTDGGGGYEEWGGGGEASYGDYGDGVPRR